MVAYILMAVLMIFSIKAEGQNVLKRYNSIEELPPELKAEFQAKENLIRISDSLFLAGEYKELIKLSDEKVKNKKFWETARSNLIAAHYFIGNKSISDSLFFRTLNRFDDFQTGISFMINSFSSIGLMRYMDIPKHKKML